ncbi:MAG: hypothetical protein RMJ44_12460, partial [Cytophagales bacterium]|nr:hypothetical protein [Cytophagales bacterium]
LYAYKVYSRVPDWKDNLSISLADEKVSPNSFFINNSLFNHFYGQYLVGKDTSSFSEAMKRIDKLCSLDVYRPSFWVKKGHLHLLINQLTEAEKAFQKAAHYQKQKGNSLQAPEFVEKQWENVKYKAIVDYPSLAYLYKHIGELFFDARDYRRAADYLMLSIAQIETETDRFQGYKDVGSIYSEIGEYEKSLEFLTKAHQLRPDDFDVNNSLGYVNLYLKNYKKSAYHFEKAFETEPTEMILHNIIMLYGLMKNKDKVTYYTKLKKTLNKQNNSTSMTK